MANEKIVTLENLITYNDKIQDKISDAENRIVQLENFTIPDSRANVLWIGTSIPAGDIQHGNNGTTQSTTTNLGSNKYPKMVADALGFNLYTMQEVHRLYASTHQMRMELQIGQVKIGRNIHQKCGKVIL